MKNYPETPIYGVKAQNMSCKAARRGISNGKLQHHPAFKTPGFRCKSIHNYGTGSGLIGQTIRCTHRREAFRFTWSG
jgi:hypothetical protein